MVYRNKLRYTILPALKFHHRKLFLEVHGLMILEHRSHANSCRRRQWALVLHATSREMFGWLKNEIKGRGSNICIFWFLLHCQRCILSTFVRDAPLTKWFQILLS